MVRRVKVMEYERAILFRGGRLVRVLEPGVHWVRGQVTRVDLRRHDVSVDVGPVFTRDGVPVGLRAQVAYRVSDAERMVLRVQSAWRPLHDDAAAALHRTVSTFRLEELAPMHNPLELDVHDRLDLEASTYGVRVEDVRVLQVRFPRAIRRRMKRNEVPGLA